MCFNITQRTKILERIKFKKTPHQWVLEGGAPVFPEVELFSYETLGERVGDEASGSEHVMYPCDVTGVYQGGRDDPTRKWLEKGKSCNRYIKMSKAGLNIPTR